MDAKTNSRSQASGLSRLILQSALATALLLIGNVAMGQTNTWDGSSSNNWNTPANWSLNQVPTSAHDVVIDSIFEALDEYLGDEASGKVER